MAEECPGVAGLPAYFPKQRIPIPNTAKPADDVCLNTLPHAAHNGRFAGRPYTCPGVPATGVIPKFSSVDELEAWLEQQLASRPAPARVERVEHRGHDGVQHVGAIDGSLSECPGCGSGMHEVYQDGFLSCGQDFMAGTICSLPAGHLDGHAPICHVCMGDWYDGTCTCRGPCILTGNPREDPDDCTTHDHDDEVDA